MTRFATIEGLAERAAAIHNQDQRVAALGRRIRELHANEPAPTPEQITALVAELVAPAVPGRAA